MRFSTAGIGQPKQRSKPKIEGLTLEFLCDLNLVSDPRAFWKIIRPSLFSRTYWVNIPDGIIMGMEFRTEEEKNIYIKKLLDLPEQIDFPNFDSNMTKYYIEDMIYERS